jgi:hypothetical protein
MFAQRRTLWSIPNVAPAGHQAHPGFSGTPFRDFGEMTVSGVRQPTLRAVSPCRPMGRSGALNVRVIQPTYSLWLSHKPFFCRKTGVPLGIFHTFFRVFLNSADYLRRKSLRLKDKRPSHPSPNNHAQNPTVGFLLFPIHAKIPP